MPADRAAAAYFAHVDGMRAVAVVAVMVYHLDPRLLPGGFVGVDVFFVISGYVVTASLARHRNEPATRFLGQFYARRLARLVPALVAMLVLTTLLYVLFVPKAWFNRAAETTGQSAFFGVSNWVLDRHVVNYFEPRAEWNPFTHTWSLGVEEQFYLVAPIFLFMALAAGATTRRQWAAIGGIGALAALSAIACHYFGYVHGARFVFYHLVFRFWELAAGVLLYLVGIRVRTLEGRLEAVYRLSGWIGLLLVFVAMALPKPTAYPWLRAAVAVAGTLLLIGLPNIERRDAPSRALRSPAALWVGLRSYALYLWHWPIFVLARWTTGLNVWPFNLAAVAISVAAAAASFRWVENPLRRSPRITNWPVGQRIAFFLALLPAGWLAGHALLASQPRLGLGQPTRQAADWYGDRQFLKVERAAWRGCEPVVRRADISGAPDALTTFDAAHCQRAATAQLFVIGDSHATAYLPMLEQLSAEQARTVTVVQVPGCAYIDLMAPINDVTDARCHRMAQASLQAVLERRRRGDIVFLPSLRLPRLILLGGQRRIAPEGGAEPADVYARSAEELRGIADAALDAPRWFVPMLDAGLKVVFELPKPVLRAHPFQCVDWFNRNNPLCADGLGERRDDQERYRAPVVHAIRALAEAHPGVSWWDPLPELCDATRCDAIVGGRPTYFDGDHVSPYGNQVLLLPLSAAISAAAR